MINNAITEAAYQEFLAALLASDRQRCVRLVQTLLAAKTSLKDLYVNLFQRAMYQVGEHWEKGHISVAAEHAATAIIERLLTIVQPQVFEGEARTRTSVIACVTDEYHQLGARMVADVFELYNWRCYFLGANTPLPDLLHLIDTHRPQVVGLSLSIYFNLPALLAAHAVLRREYPDQTLLIGGQALRWGNPPVLTADPLVFYLPTFDDLEHFLVTYESQRG